MMMTPELERRIAYGRSIRERAGCLVEAHGPEAEVQARLAAAMAGAVEAERSFWQAVADRVVRITGVPRLNHEH